MRAVIRSVRGVLAGVAVFLAYGSNTTVHAYSYCSSQTVDRTCSDMWNEAYYYCNFIYGGSICGGYCADDQCCPWNCSQSECGEGSGSCQLRNAAFGQYYCC